jgi:hypothetical protein
MRHYVVVEALQCLKHAIRDKLLFQEPVPSSILEIELEDNGNDHPEALESEGWDDAMLECDEDNDNLGLK